MKELGEKGASGSATQAEAHLSVCGHERRKGKRTQWRTAVVLGTKVSEACVTAYLYTRCCMAMREWWILKARWMSKRSRDSVIQWALPCGSRTLYCSFFTS